mmetsp:Transcript_99926/g.279906  ORF Transcript_99926/g.279906 Transcript_99926/m.279906 type:complete len:411 (+) Transcript_99926:839-2071(+)
MLLRVLRHVDSGQMALVSIVELREKSFAEFCLSNTSGTHEEKATGGLVGSGKSGLGTQNAIHDFLDRRFLANNSFHQALVQLQKSFPVALAQFSNRNSSPPRNRLCDIFRIDSLIRHIFVISAHCRLSVVLFSLDAGEVTFEIRNGTIFQVCGLFIITHAFSLLGSRLQSCKFFFDLLQFFCATAICFPFCVQGSQLFSKICNFFFDSAFALFRGLVLFTSEGRGFDLKLKNSSLELIDLLGTTIQCCSLGCSGFIDEINALVGVKATGDIFVRELCSRNESCISDSDTMMGFVALHETAQHGNRICHRWFVHKDFLETSLESRILFNVLSVFFQGCSSDHSQFSTSQHRLQQVGSIHCPIRLSGPKDKMDLVHKEHHLSIGILDFIQDRAKPFFKFSPVLSASYQSTHV